MPGAPCNPYHMPPRSTLLAEPMLPNGGLGLIDASSLPSSGPNYLCWESSTRYRLQLLPPDELGRCGITCRRPPPFTAVDRCTSVVATEGLLPQLLALPLPALLLVPPSLLASLPALHLAPLLAMLLALLLAPLLLAEPRSPPSRSPVPWR